MSAEPRIWSGAPVASPSAWRPRPKSSGAHRPQPPSPSPSPSPTEIVSQDEFYLAGVHLSQYRHPTRDPEANRLLQQIHAAAG